MAAKISQFHPKKTKKQLLRTIPSGTTVYLDYQVSKSDAQPDFWVRVSKAEWWLLPETIPCKRRRFGRLRSVRVEYETLSQFRPAKEVIRLEAQGSVVDRHEYEVVTNPFFERKEKLDLAYDPNPEPFAVADPPGTAIETIEGYEIVVRDRTMIKNTMGIDLGSTAGLLGMNLGIDFRTETLHEHELSKKITHLRKKNQKVPDDKYALRAPVGFRFDIGFVCSRTGSEGATWIPSNLAIPFEVLAQVLVYSPARVGPAGCYKRLDKAVSELHPRVKEWLDRLLNAAGLDSLSC